MNGLLCDNDISVTKLQMFPRSSLILIFLLFWKIKLWSNVGKELYGNALENKVMVSQ